MITNNYRLMNVVGRRRGRKKRACAVDGRARAARRTSCLSRLSESHAYVVIKVVSFDFQVIIESGEGVVERDAGHLPARKSRRGHGAAGHASRGRRRALGGERSVALESN